MRLFIICIFLSSLLFSNVSRFEKEGILVIDKEFDVVWQSESIDKKFGFEGAKKYCEGLSFSDYKDWRVPHIDELMSLINKYKYKPAIVTNKIKIKLDDHYWSSTLYKNNKSNAWYVSFEGGSANWSFKNGNRYVLCVRDKIE